MILYKGIPWTLGLLLVLTVPGTAQESATCSIPQSPRNIDPKAHPDPYNGRSRTSIVSKATLASVVYTPRAGGVPQTLRLCGQHYHSPIENPQGCAAKAAKPSSAGLAPGDWVEIHTVYAARLAPGPCDPETLDCCAAGPFLVRAFEARVSANGGDGPIVPPSGRPLAEWSGSTTGLSKPGECKPAAQWSFRLGCGFTVSKAQLAHFAHADPARPVQDLLSHDLTLVVP